MPLMPGREMPSLQTPGQWLVPEVHQGPAARLKHSRVCISFLGQWLSPFSGTSLVITPKMAFSIPGLGCD